MILAGPPWQYDNDGITGAAEDRYPTMGIEELCSKGPRAAENATLFLWVTNPMLEVSFRVIQAWGFKYKTMGTWWKKDGRGQGYYLLGQTEHYLLCTRGSHVPDFTGREKPGSLIEAPAREHSRKPDEIYDRIEYMYPDAKYLEMFARGSPRPGWTLWGNEVEDEEA